ncbi:hypothetical protein HA402_013453 [Bradysia odoriphaga]|nr:hypothetical protein HA402_013453 [Bradysia odoriphaga]
MEDSKLTKSNSPKTNYNLAVVTHCPSQQTATIVMVEKPSVFSGIFKNFPISNKDKQAQKTLDDRTTFLIVFFVILILFLCSVTGFFVMWFTDMYNNAIISDLVLTKNSEAFKWWTNPPLNPELRIHLFNYTNADRYMRGLDKKLKVEDLGPYTYIETFGKVNVTFNGNYTISYRENRTYTFSAEKSKGRQYDKITLPNIAFLTASAYLRNEGRMKQLGANLLITGPRAFKTLTAHEFIWGYKEPILELKNSFKVGDSSIPNDDTFGMLKTRNGTSEDVMTIFTGEDDLRKLSLIDRFNGQPKMNYWSTDECNQLDGTDGSQFPPHLMDKEQPLQVFIKAFCRKFPLVYEKEVNILNGIPAWRYIAPQNVLAHPDNNSANACYCDVTTNNCPPSGIFNASLCFGAPIFSSFPHFYTGDPKLYENIEGLEPDEKKHLTYADIHPRLAFPISGASRFQMNIQVQKAYWLAGMAELKEGQYLPILWMEVTSGKLSEELRTMIYHSTFTANAIQLSLRYGSLLISATTMAMLVAVCYYNDKNVQFLQKTQTTT